MTLRLTLLCLALAAAIGVVRAQPAANAPPRYEVEVLVFAHVDFDPSEEHFALEQAAPPPPALEPLLPTLHLEDWLLGAPQPAEAGLEPTLDPQLAEPLGESLPVEPPDTVAALTEPPTDLTSVLDYRTGRRSPKFRPLRSDELKLQAQGQALGRLGAYRPVIHLGWVQEVLSEGDAQPLNLALLGALAPAGSVRVHLSRFLHVTLDLRYQPPREFATASPSAFDLTELAMAPRYALKTQRRVRSNDINYFDHPAFGVLVVVRPAPAADPPAARPAA